MQYTVPSRHGDRLKVVLPQKYLEDWYPGHPLSSCMASPLALYIPATLPARLSLKGTKAFLVSGLLYLLYSLLPLLLIQVSAGTGTPS